MSYSAFGYEFKVNESTMYIKVSSDRTTHKQNYISMYPSVDENVTRGL